MHLLREAGVRHGGERQVRDPGHLLDRSQDDGGTDAAVEADRLDAHRAHRLGDVLGLVPVRCFAVRLDRDLSDNGKIGSSVAAFDRLVDLLQVAERLQDEEIYSRSGEGGGLLAERLASLGSGRGSVRLQPNSDRTDASGHEELVARHLPGESCRGLVDPAHLRLEAVALQAEAIRAEGVRFQDLRAGLAVLGVHFPD